MNLNPDTQNPVLAEVYGEVLLDAAIERRKEAIRADLIEFAKFTDKPAAKWYGAHHLSLIAEALMKAANTPRSRLVINTPPRHWKSSLASEKFPLWYLGLHPDRAVILASYGVSLAEKFSRTVRDTIMGNERYKLLFPKTKVRPDISRVDDWTLTLGTRSSFRAAGVGGGINGLGGHLLILDDPIMDYEQSNSQSYRKALWEWYRNVFRLRAEPDASITIITTRWTEDDLVGRILEAEKNYGGEHFDVLELPAVKNGKYLWPERFSPDEYEQIHSSIGEFAWNAQFLCNPKGDEGSEIQRSWFKFFPDLPEGANWRVRAWDIAVTSKSVDKPNPDYTATVLATMHDGVLWLGSPRLMRENWTVVQNEIHVAHSNERTLRIGVGQSLIETATIQALLREGVKLEAVDERHGDHRTRASVWINWARTGRVKLVGTEEEWDKFIAQWVSFPVGAHDDAVDVVSDVANMLHLTFNQAPRGQTSSYDNRLDILDSLVMR